MRGGSEGLCEASPTGRATRRVRSRGSPEPAGDGAEMRYTVSSHKALPYDPWGWCVARPKLAHQTCMLPDSPRWRALACLLSHRRQTALQERMDAKTSYVPRSRPVIAVYMFCTGTTAGASPASPALRAWLAGPHAQCRRPWDTRSGEPLLRRDGLSSHGSQSERACGVGSHVPSRTASTAKGNRMPK